jgi:uncharacterized phage protein gp47/JayE
VILAISTQTFTQYVANAVAAIQGAAQQLVDLTVGSILLAVVQAQAALALWLQGVALQIAALTRFATSFGPDADSWGADFGFTRLGALFARGAVTFSRFTATNQASIAVGATVQTADGTQSYTVIADPNQSTFSALLNAYIIPAGTSSALVTVQSVNAAAAANVAAGAISILAQSIPFIDTVSNALAITGGADQESDTVYHARFPQFIASLSRATNGAISFAIQSLGPNVDFTLTENQNLDGSAHLGFFYVIADDGTGAPGTPFLNAVAGAVEGVRGSTIQYAIFGPTLVAANVAMTLTSAPGFIHGTVTAAVQAAIIAAINALPIGADLPYTFLASIAYSVPGVAIVSSGYTLNGVTNTDLVTTAQQIIKAGTVAVS